MSKPIICHFPFLSGDRIFPGFILAIVLGVSPLVGTGCHQETSFQTRLSKVESCGSNTLKGTYYNFKAGFCLVPSKEDFHILYTYAQLTRIAAVSTSSLPFRVIFTDAASLKDISDFVSRAEPERIQNILLYFPSVGHGMHSGRPIAIDTNSLDEALASIQTTLLTAYDDPQSEHQKSIHDQLPFAFRNKDYRILELGLIAPPDSALKSWEYHHQNVEVVHPLASPIPWPHESKDFSKEFVESLK